MSLTRFFIFTHPATTKTYTLSLHDALPISDVISGASNTAKVTATAHNVSTNQAVRIIGDSVSTYNTQVRSEEHTSELQSHSDLVCRLLLEKKKEKNI